MRDGQRIGSTIPNCLTPSQAFCSAVMQVIIGHPAEDGGSSGMRSRTRGANWRRMVISHSASSIARSNHRPIAVSGVNCLASYSTSRAAASASCNPLGSVRTAVLLRFTPECASWLSVGFRETLIYFIRHSSLLPRLAASCPNDTQIRMGWPVNFDPPFSISISWCQRFPAKYPAHLPVCQCR